MTFASYLLETNEKLTQNLGWTAEHVNQRPCAGSLGLGFGIVVYLSEITRGQDRGRPRDFKWRATRAKYV